MSLLYRSTLWYYIRNQQIEIPDSATEGECLLLVKAYRPDDESGYFQQITRSWQWLAYAGSTPSAESILELGKRWPVVYGEVSDAT